MYWIFLALFIVAVLVPDIVRNNYGILTETRIEEFFIFTIGIISFFIFLRHEEIISFHKKEKEKDQKKINQAVKDLVESYSYIGEVNRKMDILMNIALGLTDKSILDKEREQEIYESIISASNFLMKADKTSLIIVDMETRSVKKQLDTEKKRIILDKKLLESEDVLVRKHKDSLVISSSQTINKLKSYLIIKDFDEDEEKNPKNLEILKLFISQALFLYSYAHQSKDVKK